MKRKTGLIVAIISIMMLSSVTSFASENETAVINYKDVHAKVMVDKNITGDVSKNDVEDFLNSKQSRSECKVLKVVDVKDLADTDLKGISEENALCVHVDGRFVGVELDQNFSGQVTAEEITDIVSDDTDIILGAVNGIGAIAAAFHGNLKPRDAAVFLSAAQLSD